MKKRSEETATVTIWLRPSTIEILKRMAKKRDMHYKRMIREYVSRYVRRFKSKHK